MNYTKKERELYNTDRDNVCKRLGITKNQYNWFRREGAKLHTLYELNCNGDILEGEYNTETQSLYDKIDFEVLARGLHVYYQTDPRGKTVYLSKQPILENSYNSTAEYIY